MKEIKYISIVRFEQTQWRKEENKEIFPEIFYNYGTLKISVTVHPNSRKPRIEKDLFGALHVYVSAPPLEGKANSAAIESLANYLEVKKSHVVLLSGHTSKYKLFSIAES